MLLIVEDDPELAGLLAEFLREQGFEATVTHSAEEALDVLEELRTPSLILLDLGLPGIDGEALIGRLHELSGFYTPIVALTGSTLTPEGAAAVLRKPFDLDELLETIRTHAR